MAILIFAVILFIMLNNRKIIQQENEYNLALKEKEIEMIKAVFRAEENERETLSRNLHDEVGPLLSALKLRLENYQRKLASNTFNIDACKKEVKYVDDIIGNVRTISHNLSPHFLMKFGLESALRNFASSVGQGKIKINSEIFNENKLSKHLQTNIYRIALELINNTLKYDPFEKMEIHINEVGNRIYMVIRHNGIGFTRRELDEFINKSKGIGLISVISRMNLINGEMELHTSDENNPASITLSAPMHNEN